MMLPSQLTNTLTVRPEQAADEDFLQNLLIALRWPDFAPLPLDDHQKIALLTGQFRAKRQHYATHYPNAWRAILCHQDQPIGRIELDNRPDQIWLIDIGLLPSHCGQGFGTAVLQSVLTAAQQSGRGVGLTVAIGNPAERLYRRLGFQSLDQDGANQRMHWHPAP